MAARAGVKRMGPERSRVLHGIKDSDLLPELEKGRNKTSASDRETDLGNRRKKKMALAKTQDLTAWNP